MREFDSVHLIIEGLYTKYQIFKIITFLEGHESIDAQGCSDTKLVCFQVLHLLYQHNSCSVLWYNGTYLLIPVLKRKWVWFAVSIMSTFKDYTSLTLAFTVKYFRFS